MSPTETKRIHGQYVCGTQVHVVPACAVFSFSVSTGIFSAKDRENN